MSEPETELKAAVTHAMLRFADASEVIMDFPRGNSIDEALAKLRTASTGITRPTPEIGEDELVKMALAMVASETNLEPTEAYLESRRKLARACAPVVERLFEKTVSAWAFAHDIDGAARNDLFKRLRVAISE